MQNSSIINSENIFTEFVLPIRILGAHTHLFYSNRNLEGHKLLQFYTLHIAVKFTQIPMGSSDTEIGMIPQASCIDSLGNCMHQLARAGR